MVDDLRLGGSVTGLGGSPNGHGVRSGIALCLGASFFGFYAHAGFLRRLVEDGVAPDLVVGCSAGAIVGGLYAAGSDPGQILEELIEINPFGIIFEWAIPLKGLAMMVNFPGVTGLSTGRKILSALRDQLGDVRIEDLTAPRLSIPVTNLSGCASEILSKGPLAEAILASCAVPVLLNAVRIDRNYYWDGGLANSLPVGHLCDNPGIHTVIIHHITHGSEHEARGLRRAPSIAQAFNVTHQVVNDQIFRLSCDKLEAAGKRVIYCETRTRRPSLLRKHRRGFADAGARTAMAHRRLWMEVDAAVPAVARVCSS